MEEFFINRYRYFKEKWGDWFYEISGKDDQELPDGWGKLKSLSECATYLLELEKNFDLIPSSLNKKSGLGKGVHSIQNKSIQVDEPLGEDIGNVVGLYFSRKL